MLSWPVGVMGKRETSRETGREGEECGSLILLRGHFSSLYISSSSCLSFPAVRSSRRQAQFINP